MVKVWDSIAGTAAELSAQQTKAVVAVPARPVAASAAEQDGPRIPASVRAQAARHEALAVQRGNAKKAKEFNDPMDPVEPPLMPDPCPPPPPSFNALQQ